MTRFYQTILSQVVRSQADAGSGGALPDVTLAQAICDNLDTAVAVVAAEGGLAYANAVFRDVLDLPPDGDAALPSALTALVTQAHEQDYADLAAWPAPDGRTYTPTATRLAAESGLDRAVLLSLRDITEEAALLRRRARQFDDLVMALVGMVDRRDPYAADHSQLVAQLAGTLAGAQGLSPAEREAARMAGLLMNLGKILLPRELLTRAGPLSEAEREAVCRSLGAGIELIEGVDFDVPVVETLRQAFELFDGSGRPRGLAGEEILPTARILAVANAFVSMVSERAFRPRLTVDEALSELQAGAGSAYDGAVVETLRTYLDQGGGRAHWEDSGPH